MNRTISLLLMITLIFSSETIGLVMKKKGKVDYTPYSNNQKIKALKISEALFNQDLIETGKDGFAKFVYLDDASIIKIHKNSEVYIQGDIKKRSIIKQVNIATGKMKLDIDIIHRGKVIGLFFLQFYKITTGTLLTIFIPQSCGDEICSLQENYENNQFYHKFTLYWNMITMFLFFCSYIIELRREEWCIKYLDIDNNVSDNALKQIIQSEPILDKKMDRLNLYYYRSILITCFCYFINMLLSIKILKDKYHSSSTLSCFMSFTLLVIMKLYNSFFVSRNSVKNDKMMSAYMTEFVSYNVLDQDYLENKINNSLRRP